ncbi:MAG: ABC transporter transmembrane domain-containing protein [Planctomycetota bacterium]|jgi:ATP-binding cassette subfamily B protein
MSRPLAHRLRFIARAWRPHLGFLIFLAFFTLVSSAVAAAYPLVLKRVIDQVADAVRTGADVPIASALLVLGLIAFGRVVAYQYPAFRAWVNLKIGVTLRERGFSSVLAADHRFRNRFRTGDLITRLTDDIDEYPKIAWFSCSGIFRAVDSGSKVALSVIAMVYLSPGLTALSLLPLPLMLWFVYRVRRRLRTSYVAQQKAISQTNDLLEAAFSGVQIVKAFHTQDQQADRLGEVLSARIEHQFEVQRLFAALHIADALASRAGQVVTLVVGGLMVLSGSLTLGTLYALFVYLDMLVRPLQDLPNLFVTAQQAFGSMDRYEEPGVRTRPRAAPAADAAGRRADERIPRGRAGS